MDELTCKRVRFAVRSFFTSVRIWERGGGAHQLSQDSMASSLSESQDQTCMFHDLRHEAASRFVEGGWPLHHAPYPPPDLRDLYTFMVVIT